MAKAKEKDKDKEVEEEKTTDAGGEGGEEGEGGEGGEAAPKKSKKKLIIIIAAIVLLLAAAGAGVYFSGILGGGEKKTETEAVELDEHGNPVSQTVYYTLPEFLVNLNSGTKSSAFLKTTVILELQKQTDVPLVESNLPRLVDGINTYLRELRPSDLAGSAGIQRLREEILLRTNKAIAPTQISDVLFKEIVVQ